MKKNWTLATLPPDQWVTPTPELSYQIVPAKCRWDHPDYVHKPAPRPAKIVKEKSFLKFLARLEAEIDQERLAEELAEQQRRAALLTLDLSGYEQMSLLGQP